MALRQPSSQDETERGVLGLSDAQLGSVAEDQLATATVRSAPGMAAGAFPLVDLGFDLYLRRIRTLRAPPVQIKARSFLVDEEFQASITSLHPDPNGYILLPHLPPPGWQPDPPPWAVPLAGFL